MTILGPPNRGNDPLHVLAMAAGLVAAAVLGAIIGYLIDIGTGDNSGQSAQHAQSESAAE